MKYLLGILFVFYSSNASSQVTPLVNDSGCRVLLHLGCPTKKWNSIAFEGYAEIFKEYLERNRNIVTIAHSSQSSCDSIETQNKEFDTIIDIKISPSTDTPCIGLFFREKDNTIKQYDLTGKFTQILHTKPYSRITVQHGYLCAPLSFITLAALFAGSGEYGGPLLVCDEPKNTAPDRSFPSSKDPSQNYAGTPCEPFTRPTPANGASIYGNDSIVVYGTRAYRCETQGDRKVWTLYGPREKLGKDWRQYEAGRLEN